MLWGVTRRVHRLELDVANHERLAVLESNVIELVLPIGAALVGEEHHCARDISKLACAA